MSFPIEDFERVPEMDKLWLLEKEQEMFVEWQMWEEEQERLAKQPARIVVLTPQEHEAESDSIPLS